MIKRVPKIARRAWLLAQQHHIDVFSIEPTGGDGRITEEDVMRVIQAMSQATAETPAQEEAPVAEVPAEVPATEENPADVPVPEEGRDVGAVEKIPEEKSEQTAIVAKTVSKEDSVKDHCEESKRETVRSFDSEAYPHTDVIIPGTETAPDGTPMTVRMSFDASSLIRLRTMIEENGEALGIPQVTVNDMILFAAVKLLKKNKALNAHFLGDKIRYFDGVHLGFAIDTDHGMEIPVVFEAEKLSLCRLSQITNALTAGARAGKISAVKTKTCASFTVTDLGSLGVEYFTPNLKAPQTGILGVCARQRRIKEIGGKDVSYSCIPLSLTFDPRALDTTSAAKFLRDLCVSLENFELLLLK